MVDLICDELLSLREGAAPRIVFLICGSPEDGGSVDAGDGVVFLRADLSGLFGVCEGCEDIEVRGGASDIDTLGVVSGTTLVVVCTAGLRSVRSSSSCTGACSTRAATLSKCAWFDVTGLSSWSLGLLMPLQCALAASQSRVAVSTGSLFITGDASFLDCGVGLSVMLLSACLEAIKLEEGVEPMTGLSTIALMLPNPPSMSETSS
jgi:hypothetical protein